MSFKTDDFYQARELNVVLDYFRRKSEGDWSSPVPALGVFENVIQSKSSPFSLATFAERELRAIYLGIGKPVSQEQALEFIECWDCGEASGLAGEIAEIEDEIKTAEAELDRLRCQLEELQAKGVEPDAYIPEDLMPVIEQLQREGA